MKLRFVQVSFQRCQIAVNTTCTWKCTWFAIIAPPIGLFRQLAIVCLQKGTGYSWLDACVWTSCLCSLAGGLYLNIFWTPIAIRDRQLQHCYQRGISTMSVMASVVWKKADSLILSPRTVHLTVRLILHQHLKEICKSWFSIVHRCDGHQVLINGAGWDDVLKLTRLWT